MIFTAIALLFCNVLSGSGIVVADVEAQALALLAPQEHLMTTAKAKLTL